MTKITNELTDKLNVGNTLNRELLEKASSKVKRSEILAVKFSQKNI